MRALTALKQVGKATQHTDGRPPEMPLAKIVKDRDNPRAPLHLRTPEEQQQQNELNESVRQRGVKSPVSLRVHPTEPDTWVINHGHCRFDAAQAAGFTTIPYFIDPNFDSYDQIAENLHRSDLPIWAIANFIKRKLDEGQSKTEIAQRLGKDGLNYVTEHLALVDAPGCVHQAYASAVRSPRTLYDLRRAHDEFPDQVDAWCRTGVRVTRDAIRELMEELRHDVIGGTSGLYDKGSSAGGDHDMDRHTCDEPGSGVVQPPDASGAEVTGLRHDVIVSTHQEALATQSNAGREQQSTKPIATGDRLRHDVTRRDPPSSANAQPASTREAVDARAPAGLAASDSFDLGRSIPVRYKGRNAAVSTEVTVMITFDGEESAMEVRLSDLEFVMVDAANLSNHSGVDT